MIDESSLLLNKIVEAEAMMSALNSMEIEKKNLLPDEPILLSAFSCYVKGRLIV